MSKPIHYMLQNRYDGTIWGTFTTFDKAEMFIIHNDLDTKMWLIEEVDHFG